VHGFLAEDQKGAITTGQMADLAVLSADYFSIPEEDIKHLESVLTVVGGKVVYASAEFSKVAPPPLQVSPDWSPDRMNGRRSLDERSIPDRPLKSMGDVGELLEETINRVRRSPFDIRSANAIGFLAGVLLKALDSRIEERLAHLEAVMTNRGAESEAFDFRPAKERPHEHPSAATEGD